MLIDGQRKRGIAVAARPDPMTGQGFIGLLSQAYETSAGPKKIPPDVLGGAVAS